MNKEVVVNGWPRKAIEYLIVILVILITVSALMFCQLQHHVGLILADTLFHDNRIYDMAQQLLHHNISYFQMNYGAYQSGRVINPIYGPFFAYFLGILLLFAGSWFRFQVLTNYLLFLIGGIGMYHLAKKAKSASWAAGLAMLLFLVTGYVAYWIQGNTFNSWGAVLMPYVLIEGLKMIQAREKQINWLTLGLIMAIIAQVHLLSIIFSLLALIPFFIYGLMISNNKREMLVSTVKAILLFIVLTANVWSAYLLLYTTNHMSATFAYPLFDTAMHLGSSTVKGTILFSTLVIFILQLIYVLINAKKQKLNLFLTLEGTIFFILSSQVFPWQFFDAHLPFFRTYLQFPNRLTVIAYPLLYVGVALSLTQLFRMKSKLGKGIGVMSVVWVVLAIIFNINANILKNTQQTMGVVAAPHAARWSRDRDLNLLIINIPSFNPEYLPLHDNINGAHINITLNKKLYIPNRDHFHKEVLAGGKLKIMWQADKKQKTSLLPVVMYHQAKLEVNGKNKGQIKHYNAIGMPVVKNRVGENEAILTFVTPHWFTVLLILNLISWVVIIIFASYQVIRFLLKKPNLLTDKRVES